MQLPLDHRNYLQSSDWRMSTDLFLQVFRLVLNKYDVKVIFILWTVGVYYLRPGYLGLLSMRLGFISSILGMANFSSPFSKVASTLSPFTPVGSRNTPWKDP